MVCDPAELLAGGVQVARVATSMPFFSRLSLVSRNPGAWAAWEQLSQNRTCSSLTGHGISHPRRLGVASHFA
ncbi:endonuclease V [Klebsiella pneumoniae]|uniref:endonuclease V n=1 Tax=Klebsiella pneumoniae TaxID=573 RepID=UPI003C6D7BA2